MTDYPQGSTRPLTALFFSAPGVPVAVSGLSLTVIRLSDGLPVAGFPLAGPFVNPVVGTYIYSWSIPAAQPVGEYLVSWSGNVAGDPINATETIEVTLSGGSLLGPCFSSWDIDTSCCADFWATLTPAEQATATSVAVFTIWAATGRRYGPCPVTVRPCGPYCSDNGIAGYSWSNGVFVPYIVNGVWRNCWCGMAGGCRCEPSQQIYLPGPVASVTSVTQDGVLVDPSAYRVDDLRWLVRTDGNAWTQCQDYDVDSGTGTLIVSYNRGNEVPAHLMVAAGIYACEWAKACQGTACELPSRVVTLSRQGTTFQMTDIDNLLTRGLTGIQRVDQLIALENPYGVPWRMRLYSPDMDFPRTVTTP